MSKIHFNMICALFFMAPALSSAAANCPSLKGSYGFSLQGQVVNGPPYAAVGLLSVARGSFALQLTESEGGVIFRRVINGEVEIKDCGVTLSGIDQNFGFQLKGQITDQGREVFLTEIRQVKPVVASGIMRPVGLSQCSDHTLKGRYNYITQGYEQISSGNNSWIPVGKVGKEEFDGKGCSIYEESIKQGVDFSTASGRLNYKVAKNCSFELIEAGVPVFFGVVVDSGRIMPYLKLADSATRSGEYQRVDGVSSPRNCH